MSQRLRVWPPHQRPSQSRQMLISLKVPLRRRRQPPRRLRAHPRIRRFANWVAIPGGAFCWRGVMALRHADDQEPPVVLLERSGLDVESARRIVEFHLYHARLLTPRAVVQREGNIHWLVVEAPATYEAPFTSIGDGGQLEARSALKAGVGLANALSYLHTNGVAHGHVGPNAVLVHDGRAYLSGIELCHTGRNSRGIERRIILCRCQYVGARFAATGQFARDGSRR